MNCERCSNTGKIPAGLSYGHPVFTVCSCPAGEAERLEIDRAERELRLNDLRQDAR